MPSTFTNVLESAKTLTEDERYHLIDELLADIGEVECPLDEEWRKEIDRRSDDIDRGLVQTMTWAEVKAGLHADE